MSSNLLPEIAGDMMRNDGKKPTPETDGELDQTGEGTGKIERNQPERSAEDIRRDEAGEKDRTPPR
jgi:hypothetical protein